MTTATEIADKIASEQNLTKAQAKTIVDSVFSQVAGACRQPPATLGGTGRTKGKARRTSGTPS